MLASFHNSFTGRHVSKFAVKSTLNIPPHLKSVATDIDLVPPVPVKTSANEIPPPLMVVVT